MKLASNNNYTALPVLVLSEPSISPILFKVRGPYLSSYVQSVSVHLPIEGDAFILGRHRFSQFVGQNECRLVIASDSSRELDRRNALGTIHDDEYRREYHCETQLPPRQDRPACDAVLMVAGFALKLAPRTDVVCVATTAARALCDLRERYRNEIKKLTVDIDHLDACIRLFDPNTTMRAIKEYVTKHRAQKGSVKRFVLNTLREASKPMTSREITELWVQDRGLQADEATLTIIRKRIGACIKTCVVQDLVEFAGHTTDHGANGPYKLWTLKRGSV